MIKKKKFNNLNEIQDALVQNLKAGDSEYIYQCEKCRDSTWIFNEETRSSKRCACFNNSLILKNKERLEYILGKHNIMQLKSEQRQIVDNMKAASQQSCWLSGITGQGKTALIYSWLVKQPDSMYITNGSNIESLFREQTDSGYRKKSIRWQHYKFVVIDDIDKDWPFSESMSKGIYKTLDEIIRSNCILLITANMTVEKFCSVFPDHQREPLMRRLREKLFFSE